MRSWERYDILKNKNTKFLEHHMTRKSLMSKLRRDVNKTIFPYCPKSSKVIFDIGANMGVYTCWLAGHYKDTAHVYAFEPVKFNFNYLVKNVELNKLSNEKLNALTELTQEVSAIRQFTAQQQNRVKQLQDGYDWNIIKRFCFDCGRTRS